MGAPSGLALWVAKGTALRYPDIGGYHKGGEAPSTPLPVGLIAEEAPQASYRLNSQTRSWRTAHG